MEKLPNREHPIECECPKCKKKDSEAFMHSHFYEMV